MNNKVDIHVKDLNNLQPLTKKTNLCQLTKEFKQKQIVQSYINHQSICLDYHVSYQIIRDLNQRRVKIDIKLLQNK